MVGAEGNALGPLISSAKKKGIFSGHDTALLDSVMRAMDWVSAERSEAGDSHNVTDSGERDAWLMVHVVGALIVWLAEQC
jgi:hypothetical protein